MKSLVLSRWAPDSANGGAALRNAQNIAALAKLGPVEVVTIGVQADSAPHEQDNVTWRNFPLLRKRPLRGAWLFGMHPITAAWYQPDVVEYLLSQSRETCDLAVIEEIALASYLGALRRTGIQTVFDAHNVEAPLRADLLQSESTAKRAHDRLRHFLLDHRLTTLERNAATSADAVWACSEIDANQLQQIYALQERPYVVPNAIPVDTYAPARAVQLNGVPIDDMPILLYIGSYAYPPNEAAALRLISDILPSLRQKGLKMKLALVGRAPTGAMYAAAANDPAVEITDAVDSVLPWLSRPCIVTLPITQGSGTRLKVLEAFAAGCPLVSTAKGAEGIAISPGKNMLLAESDDDFVKAIKQLATDADMRRRIGRGGYEAVAHSYSWQAAADTVAAAASRLRAKGSNV